MMAAEGKTALVAEDDEPIRSLLRVMLRREGFQVFEAADGFDAMEILSTKAIHLLVLDMMMPRLSGFEVIERLTAGPEMRPACIVVVSATPAAQLASVRERVNAVIGKPFDIETLRAVIRGC
jgi:CheY-like chemotaxis protein